MYNNFSPNTISTHISPSESNPRGMCQMNPLPGYYQNVAPMGGHTRAHSHIDMSKCSNFRHSNVSGKDQNENVLMKKLLMKRTIQSYFMSSQECCSFCARKKEPFRLIQNNLNSKYLTGMDYYNVKVINDIIYNDTTNLVSVFKDYLIFDDISEFLKRFYNSEESGTRLTKIYTFYDKYSKVFPNYIILEENRYMFKNIERKQIAIDERQQFFAELEEKEKIKEQKKKDSQLSQFFSDESQHMFNTKFIESVLHAKTNSQVTENFPFEVVSRMLDSHIQNSSALDGNKSKAVPLEQSSAKKRPEIRYIPNKPVHEYNLPELVEKFLTKDVDMSDSTIFGPDFYEQNQSRKHENFEIPSRVEMETKSPPKHETSERKTMKKYAGTQSYKQIMSPKSRKFL